MCCQHLCLCGFPSVPTSASRPDTPASHPPWEQDSSSEPSPQSSKKLQRRLALMHFLFSHRNSFLSRLQLLGLAVGDSVGTQAAAVTLHVPRHPAPWEPQGVNSKGRGQAGTQDACTHLPVLGRSGQSKSQHLGQTQGTARTSLRAAVTHCPVHAGRRVVPMGSPTHRSPSHPCCLHSCQCRRTVDRSTDIPGRSCSGTVCWGDTGISLHQQIETNGDGERRRHSQAVTLVMSCCSASAHAPGRPVP